MIRLPLYLVIAQWVLLAALGVLVVILFRQLGRLMTGRDTRAELGPPLNSKAEAISYARPGSADVEQLRPGNGRPLLLAFVDPTCPSCEDLVSVLGALERAGELDALRVLLLISDPPSYLQISSAFESTSLEIGRPAKRDGLAYYRVTGTPLLVAIDGSGVVRASRSVVREADVRAMARSCLEPVAGLPT